MKTMLYKNGVPIGEREIPYDLVKKACEVRDYMLTEGVTSFCGLTDSLASDLKINELQDMIDNFKRALK